jgi:hypothetical protein
MPAAKLFRHVAGFAVEGKGEIAQAGEAKPE